MKRLACLVMAVCLALSLVNCAFAATKELVVFNWEDYIDKAVLDQFTEETGIKIKYTNFTTNEEMYVKISSGGGNYDVLFPSDYIIERMIKEDRLAKLNLSEMPNTSGLLEWLKTPGYDPAGEYSVPYMWGTVGILYDESQIIAPVTSWEALFDESYLDNVFMMDSIRDTIGLALKSLGYSMNTRDADELEAAKALLIKQKLDGIVKAYQVDETKDKMVAGEAALAVVWSGDAVYAMERNESLGYVIPEEGSNVWVDGMVVPKDSQNLEAAQQFIDFLCRPDIAAINMEEIGYSSPIAQVADESEAEGKIAYAQNPPREIIDICEFFHDISEHMDMYDRIWMEVKTAR